MLVRVVAGVFVNVRSVSFRIAATVPIITSSVVLRMLPTLSSVRKAVPVPTTFVSPAVTEIMPERRVFGQAVASHVPVAALLIFWLTACAGDAGRAANSIIAIIKIAAVRYMEVFVPFFVFIFSFCSYRVCMMKRNKIRLLYFAHQPTAN